MTGTVSPSSPCFEAVDSLGVGSTAWTGTASASIAIGLGGGSSVVVRLPRPNDSKRSLEEARGSKKVSAPVPALVRRQHDCVMQEASHHTNDGSFLQGRREYWLSRFGEIYSAAIHAVYEVRLTMLPSSLPSSGAVVEGKGAILPRLKRFRHVRHSLRSGYCTKVVEYLFFPSPP